MKSAALDNDFDSVRVGYYRNRELAAARIQASPARQKFIEWAVGFVRSHRNESIGKDDLFATWDALPLTQRATIDAGCVKDYFRNRCGVALSMGSLQRLAVHGDEPLDNANGSGSWEDDHYDDPLDGGGSGGESAAAAADPIYSAGTAAAKAAAAAPAAATDPIDPAGIAAAKAPGSVEAPVPAAAAADPNDLAGTAAAKAAATAAASAVVACGSGGAEAALEQLVGLDIDAAEMAFLVQRFRRRR